LLSILTNLDLKFQFITAVDTPLNEILHPNAILSDKKCQRIRELPFGPLKEVAELSTEIESLQA
jgi:hypothetical protein